MMNGSCGDVSNILDLTVLTLQVTPFLCATIGKSLNLFVPSLTQPFE
jgi:hypothetical protein